MVSKRRAAASIFNEQQMKQMEEEALDEEYTPEEEPMVQTNEDALLSGMGAGDGLEVEQVAGTMPKLKPMKKTQKRQKTPIINLLKSSEEMQLEKEPIQIRITGRWFWQRAVRILAHRRSARTIAETGLRRRLRTRQQGGLRVWP